MDGKQQLLLLTSVDKVELPAESLEGDERLCIASISGDMIKGLSAPVERLQLFIESECKNIIVEHINFLHPLFAVSHIEDYSYIPTLCYITVYSDSVLTFAFVSL